MMMMCVHDRERRQDKERETAFLHCHWSVYISNSPWSRWHRPHKFYRQGWGSKQSCHGVVALPLGLQHTQKSFEFYKGAAAPFISSIVIGNGYEWFVNISSLKPWCSPTAVFEGSMCKHFPTLCIEVAHCVSHHFDSNTPTSGVSHHSQFCSITGFVISCHGICHVMVISFRPCHEVC